MPTFFLWASQIALNSTRPQSRLYPDIPRPDTPIIYTSAFPILTAWLGQRSICNKCFFLVTKVFKHFNMAGCSHCLSHMYICKRENKIISVSLNRYIETRIIH